MGTPHFVSTYLCATLLVPGWAQCRSLMQIGTHCNADTAGGAQKSCLCLQGGLPGDLSVCSSVKPFKFVSSIAADVGDSD